jgi:hypothetical protein
VGISSALVLTAVGLRIYSKISSARVFAWDDCEYCPPKNQIGDYTDAGGRYKFSGFGICAILQLFGRLCS